MPYQPGQRLSGETASKLGHLDVLNSPFVQSVVSSFEQPVIDMEDDGLLSWQQFNFKAKALKYIFAIDGSMQTLKSTGVIPREVAFVKTALLHLDPNAVAGLDPIYPHPLSLRKIMTNSALFHATVFPIKNIKIEGSTWMEGVRRLIYDSLKDPTLEGEPYETLKWLLYKKWDPASSSLSPNFECPICHEEIEGLPYDKDEDQCSHCGTTIYASDVLGFHMEMADDGAAESLASAYMLIHETLMLFTAIRFFWERKNNKVLNDALFLKDGPLALRGQYTKIVPNIRAFIKTAKLNGYDIHICGQEKTGKFFDHLQGLSRFVHPLTNDESPQYAILSHSFIRDEVQRVQNGQYRYGFKTNYGEKVYAKLNSHHAVVLSIATGEYVDIDNFPSRQDDYIGIDRILATLPNLVSFRHESALIPIELVNGIASLSNYPSAKVLKLFTGLE